MRDDDDVGSRWSVTGGASGLGAAVAGAVRDAGGTPVVLDIAPGPEWCECERVDLADGRAAEGAVADVIERHGRLRRRGHAPPASTPAATWPTWPPPTGSGWSRSTCSAPPRSCGPRCPRWSAPGTGGDRRLHPRAARAAGDATAYCASKFGVVGFTRALAAETAGRVGVTLLVPGGMATAFFDGRPEQYKPAGRRPAQPARGRRLGGGVRPLASPRAARCASWC